VKVPDEKVQPKVMFSNQQIQKEVWRIAQEIAAHYREEVSDQNPLILVVVLKGGVFFGIDLARCLAQLRVPHEFRFERVKSGWEDQRDSGEPAIFDPLTESLTGRHVLVVEDIVDSGKTLKAIQDHYSKLDPLSLSVAVMLLRERQENGATDPISRWVGFRTNERCWFVGYGMDSDELHRSLLYIGCLPGEELPPGPIS